MKKIGMRKSENENVVAFTLIELLVVISVIAVLAAFTIPVLKGVKRNQYLKQTQAQMAQLETAIESYKAAYGFYPPSAFDPLKNQLYYELTGTTNVSPNNPTFASLDNPDLPYLTAAMISTAFGGGVSGFINCNKPGSSEDTTSAKDFLTDLNSNQIHQNYTNNGVPITLLIGSAGGPDLAYQPLGVPGVNPWRYRYPGTNNPTSYDLWMQLRIAGTTNLICNWTKQVEINSPLP